MSGVQIYHSPLNGATIETIYQGEQVVFSVPDLAKALEYSNTAKAVRHLPTKHVVKIPNRALGSSEGGHDIPFTTEAGVYRLIMRSNMPKAMDFQDWVTDELLPTVRRAHEVGIDVVTELKEQIEALEEDVKVVESEATGAYLQLEEAYEKAYRAARLSSSKDTWAMNVYSGKTFNIPPKYQTSMEEWKRLAEEEGWDM